MKSRNIEEVPDGSFNEFFWPFAQTVANVLVAFVLAAVASGILHRLGVDTRLFQILTG